MIYFPIFLILVFLSCHQVGKKRYFALLLPIIGFVLVLAPWYFRNYFVVGPGAGLSTTGGLNFYFAHNDTKYGWHPLSDTELAGLSEIETNRLGYKLGWEHIMNSGITDIVDTIANGSKEFFISDSDYAIYWNIQRLRNNGSFESKEIPGISQFYNLNKFYYVLLIGALLSVIFIREFPIKLLILTYGFVLFSWITYSWIFWSKARFRFSSEVLFCILTSLFITKLISRIKKKNKRLASAA